MRKVLFAYLLSLLMACPLLADDPVGMCVAVRGDAWLLAEDGSERIMEIKGAVYLGDTIRTGRSGRMQVMFNDSTIISLGRQSEVVIRDYFWEAGNAQSAMRTEVKEGVFRIMGGAITRDAPQNFVTETPAATIGIRGSMYAGRVRDGALMVVFHGGKGIFVQNSAGQVEIDQPGFGTQIDKLGAAPRAPKRMSAKEMGQLNSELETDDSEQEFDASEEPAQEGDEADEAVDEEPAEQVDDEPAEQPADEPAEQDDDGWDEPLGDFGTQTASVVDDSVTQNLQTDIEKQAAAAISNEVDLTGRFAASQLDLSYPSSGNNSQWRGAINAKSVDGYVQGSVTAADGKVFNFNFKIPGYKPDAAYQWPVSLTTQARTVSLLGQNRSFSMQVLADNKGEFAVFSVPGGNFSQGGSYLYNEVGYVGVAADALPTDGIDGYAGVAGGFGELAGINETYGSQFFMEVNWHNGKAIGFIDHDKDNTDESGPHLLFYGDVSGSGLTNVTFIGGHHAPAPSTITTASGSGANAQFYGSEYQGFGLSGSGSYYDVQSSQTAPTGSWNGVAAGFREPQDSIDVTAPTGTAGWKGYVIGLSEDMASPDVDRRIFRNADANNFSLSLNRDAGTLSGSITAADVYDPANNNISNLQVGGSHGSAYVLDDNFVAILGSDTNNAISDSAGPGGLKPRGNYLVVEDPARQFSQYFTWGHWEVSYDAPSDGADYHLHMPGSMWIAGAQTPVAQLPNITGNYSGGARGFKIDLSNQFSELTNGSCNIAVNFSTGAVTGSIAFDQKTLNLVAGVLPAATNTFNAQMAGASSSSVNGTFYGPNAEGMAGSFDAYYSTDGRYVGIFGGDR